MGFISANRKQMDLLGFSLEDLVPKDAKCRFVVDFMSQLDLAQLYQRYSSQGNDAYDPSILLSTWFYAYSERVTTTRKLEDKCQRDLHFMYVSGNLKPDHSTLSRFRRNHADLLAEYFVQIIKIALDQGISDFKRIAIDGSKIQAVSSAKNSKTSDELSQYLSRVRQDIKEYMNQCELLDDDSDDPDDIDQIRKKITDLKALEETLVERQKTLEERKRSLKHEHRNNHKINIAEPEARNMNKVNGDQKRPAYNVQLSVDTQTQLIVSNDTIQDPNDYDQLSRQHQHVLSNLGDDPERCFVYDAGYHNLEHLAYVYANQLNVFVASPRKDTNPDPVSGQDRRFDRTDFVYDQEHDRYICPAGHLMLYEKNYRKDGKWSGRVYKCQDCPSCSYQSQCLIKNTRYRRIRREHRESYAEWMYDTGQSDQAKHLQKLRRTSVEPVFGNLKENLGFRRFRLKGQKLASGEFNLMCIAHNLNKLFVLMKPAGYDVQLAIDNLKTLCQRTIQNIVSKIIPYPIPLRIFRII
jgi:transposase